MRILDRLIYGSREAQEEERAAAKQEQIQREMWLDRLHAAGIDHEKSLIEVVVLLAERVVKLENRDDG